jgi:hypothetical protein
MASLCRFVCHRFSYSSFYHSHFYSLFVYFFIHDYFYYYFHHSFFRLSSLFVLTCVFVLLLPLNPEKKVLLSLTGGKFKSNAFSDSDGSFVFSNLGLLMERSCCSYFPSDHFSSRRCFHLKILLFAYISIALSDPHQLPQSPGTTCCDPWTRSTSSHPRWSVTLSSRARQTP